MMPELPGHCPTYDTTTDQVIHQPGRGKQQGKQRIHDQLAECWQSLLKSNGCSFLESQSIFSYHSGLTGKPATHLQHPADRPL